MIDPRLSHFSVGKSGRPEYVPAILFWPASPPRPYSPIISYHESPGLSSPSNVKFLLQICYESVTTYYISVTEVLHTCNTSVPYPTIGPGYSVGELQAGTGPPIVLQAASWKSWKLGAGTRRPAGYCIQAGLASRKLRRRAGKSTTPKLDGMSIPAATSWSNAHQKSYCGKLEYSNIR